MQINAFDGVILNNFMGNFGSGPLTLVLDKNDENLYFLDNKKYLLCYNL